MSKFRSQLDSLVAGNAPERVKLPPRRTENMAPVPEQPSADEQNSVELAQIKSTLQTLTSSLGQLAAQSRAAEPVVQPAPQIDHEYLVDAMQNNMRDQVSTEVKKIRRELENLQANHQQKANRQASDTAVIADIQRISKGISELQSRHSNSNEQLGELAGNLQNIRGDIRAIAERPQPAFDPSQISNSIQENYREIAMRLDGLGNLQSNDRFDALNEKLDTLRSGLTGLKTNPVKDNRGMENIESQLQQLSTTIAVMSDKNSALSSATEEFLPGYFENLDRRLDEITRAVVAAAPQENAQLDAVKLERIEARLASLSKSLEAVNAVKPAPVNVGQFPELAKMPKQIESTIARLESSISQMGTTLGGSSRFVQESIGGQLTALSEKIDVLAARDLSNTREANTGELELKIDALAGALEQVSATGIGATQNLQKQIRDLAVRIDHIIKTKPQPNDNNGQFQTLEGQIKSISAQLDTLGTNAPNPDLESRLGGIEQQIQSSQNMAVESATKAAQQVLAQLNTADFGEAHVSAISNLTADLQKLSSSSSELKGLSLETFDAVRDSLSMILDRVNAIELKMAHKGGSEKPAAAMSDNDDIMEVAREYATGLSTQPVQNSELPAQWIDEMDKADHQAQSADELEFKHDHSREMANATSAESATAQRAPADQASRENVTAESMAAVGAPSLEIREIPEVPNTQAFDRKGSGGVNEDPSRYGIEVASEYAGEINAADIGINKDTADTNNSALEMASENDMPLEPGSGAPKLTTPDGGPDMEALMRKANEREKNSPKEKAAHNPTDFIAAARRAAQAAAAEASEVEAPVSEPENAEEPAKVSGFKQLLSQRRKPIIVAASVVLLAVLALPIASNLLGGSGELNDSEFEQSTAPQSQEVSDGAQSKLAKVEGADAQSQDVDTTVKEPASESNAVRSIEMQPDSEANSEPSNKSNEIDKIARELEASPAIESASNMNSATGTISSDTALPGMSMPSDNHGNAPGVPLTMAPMPPKEVGPQALRQAAASGEPSAQFEVARRYTAGLNGKPNLQEASVWYERSANAGFAPAQYRIGNFYEKGHGVASDVKMAAQWYKKAADNGNALAMHNLAVINAMGVLEGGANMGEAVSWFKKAAEHGVKDSQVNLGILYAKAMGIDEDLTQAYKWFAIAAKAGDKDASQKRDTVAKAMRPEQLSRARGELELWRPATVKPEANKAPVKPEWFANSETTASLDSVTVIKTTQSMLNKLGFEAGPADGKMGTKTSNAIRAFQKRAGIEITGKPSEELLEIMKKAS